MKPLPKGFFVFGSLLIFGSLHHINALIAMRSHYYAAFSYMSNWLITARYAISLSNRLIFLSCGLGIFRRRELFRKITIVLSILLILAIPLKHPYTGFKRHTAWLDQQKDQGGWPPIFKKISFQDYTGISMAVQWSLDVLFFGSMIFYFTRPKVKSYFK